MANELSIVIVSFNVKKLLLDCLESIYKNKKDTNNWQIIVVDNASTDGSVEAVEKKFPKVNLIKSPKNLGYARGNNLAVSVINSDYVLFLNPDTIIKGDVIQKTLNFLKENPKVGAVTCKVLLPDGKLDYSCKRGFPAPWSAFCYFTGLAKVFPNSKFFAGYTATYLDSDTTNEVECISGTFFMVRRLAAREVGWWDEDYFWNGEDIEFCFRLREKGWKIYYYPKGEIVHFKGSSSGLWKSAKVSVSKEVKLRSAKAGIEAMRIFYEKHYLKNTPFVFRKIVLLGINLLEKVRLLKIKLS